MPQLSPLQVSSFLGQHFKLLSPFPCLIVLSLLEQVSTLQPFHLQASSFLMLLSQPLQVSLFQVSLFHSLFSCLAPIFPSLVILFSTAIPF